MDRIKAERAIAGLTEWRKHVQTNSDIDRDISMAIEALKAQLSQEGTTKGTTSDTISKTETVKHLRRVLEATVPNTDYDEGFIDGIEFGISTVSTMPPAQPVATDTNVGDTISRKAAIDALDCINGVEEVLRSLPTAQPEPKEGRWIEYTRVIIPEPINQWEQAWYCSECGYGGQDCEDGSAWLEWKFCPNCGADMRGDRNGIN